MLCSQGQLNESCLKSIEQVNKSKTKILVYTVAKALGLFHISKAITRKELRILCYHGTWKGGLEDNCFGNILFISPALFEKRMKLIKRLGYPVVSLDDGLSMLEQNQVHSNEVVITIDDGWYSTYEVMIPELERNGFPATVYSTTYYSVKNKPVTRLMNRYILRNTAKKKIDLAGVAPGLKGIREISTVEQRELLAEEIYKLNSSMSISEECDTYYRLAEICEVDIDSILANRNLNLMTLDELKDSSNRGIDIQLHTHRHLEVNADNCNILQDEVMTNKEILVDVAHDELKHFCYPSGYFTNDSERELKKVNVVSATTCLPGLNGSAQNRFKLLRITDSQAVSDIEFEAAMSGFRYLYQHALKRIGLKHRYA